MTSIVFVDIEACPGSGKILDIGAVSENGAAFHANSLSGLAAFIKGARFICGHNIFSHDLKYIQSALLEAGFTSSQIIDTLYLSPLLFPEKPYHRLMKDDKLQTEDINNPFSDALKTKDLFFDEVAAFAETDDRLKQIYWLLLNNRPEFSAFFDYAGYSARGQNVEAAVREMFYNLICAHSDLPGLISEHPADLAYCLALINCRSRYSITPPWVLKHYPEVERIMFQLRNSPCVSGCSYCSSMLDIGKGLKRFFGFEAYRTFGGEPLQERAVKAAVDNRSILAVFPTGGGKSVTFQVPALISGETAKGLTVVISPLQSLMKDQVDNLEKIGITDAVTINGLLDPIERASACERVEDGSASLLYISPESLRSSTIERLLLGRKIVRFVVDEAHCFSSWGQDFRVDYLYIGDFIQFIQRRKNIATPIAVSCFTATAKPQVIGDITTYFKTKLGLDLDIFRADETRHNLQYRVYEKQSEEEKYLMLRTLIEGRDRPAIVYVSTTLKAYRLARRLTDDGFKAAPYHGKMDIREKTANQNAFISGETPVMVATSAFGMGVDKKDVAMVIHFDIPDSLENYMQESGRAGRDEAVRADCVVLFNEEDLNTHFRLLNQTRIDGKEIQQIWKSVKEITKLRSTVSNSALEIARRAGWDDSIRDIETRVKTAVAALEDAGYLKRRENLTTVFADSILARTAQEAIDRISASDRFQPDQKQSAVRIIKKLISSRSRQRATEEVAEARVDYISDHLGLSREEVISIVNLLREENILADTKDLTAYIRKGEKAHRALSVVGTFNRIEDFLLPVFSDTEKTYNIKQLNEDAACAGCPDTDIRKIQTVINFWASKNWIKRQRNELSVNHMVVLRVEPAERLRQKLERRHELSRFIVEFLYRRAGSADSSYQTGAEPEELVTFSVHEIRRAFEKRGQLFQSSVSIRDIEEALLYLSKIDAIKIEGGFMVIYNRMTIERLEQDLRKRYLMKHYQKLRQFYLNRVQQIHIVGEYAKKMIENYRSALQFAEDYFRLEYGAFMKTYFPGTRQKEISRTLTAPRFQELFGALSPMQLEIIRDSTSKYIVVAAGPGSGKTRVLVHKLASLLLMEDVRPEQLLMLTFSRAAATEFKKRLVGLIGAAAHYVEIKTFHSYCFDILGKVGSLEKSGVILQDAVEKIRAGEVEPSRMTKTVLVIDEAQDMDAGEYALISALMAHNEDMRVIAVGDDDQNIYEFRGADARYLEQLITEKGAVKYELTENYRSRNNLVEFTNQFVKTIRSRIKKSPIVSRQQGTGRIKIVQYRSTHLVRPLVEDILSAGVSGTAAVLTVTNDEALQTAGMLLQNGIRAKLIQTNDGFNLYNLQETRFFLDRFKSGQGYPVIREDMWQSAKQELENRFGNSSLIDVCRNMIRDFEQSSSPVKYLSDLEVFFRESNLEDFTGYSGDLITVSTIHKAKGKEFDHVWILLDNVSMNSDEAKRRLYVAMTRARQKLTVHLNGSFLDGIESEPAERVMDQRLFPPPDRLAICLTFRDVFLDYFINTQHRVDRLMSGDELIPQGDICSNVKGQPVLRFSRQFLSVVQGLSRDGYRPAEARINFIIYWKKEGSEQEIKTVLPEICFERIRKEQEKVGG